MPYSLNDMSPQVKADIAISLMVQPRAFNAFVNAGYDKRELAGLVRQMRQVNDYPLKRFRDGDSPKLYAALLGFVTARAMRVFGGPSESYDAARKWIAEGRNAVLA